ncbi:MAG: ATP-binding protein [Treponema sp.]|nr:ATP-binding protein [Treponema sp.]
MKLANRLALAFLAVIFLSASLTFVLVRSTTESHFRTFVYAGDAEKARAYASILGDWYRERGSWAGVQDYLSGLPRTMYESLAGDLYGSSTKGLVASFSADTFSRLLSDRVALADSEGRIVADTALLILGTMHPARHLERGIPVMAEFKRVGTVLVGSMIDPSFTGASGSFVDSLGSSLILATLLSGGLAFVLGLALTRRMTGRLAILNAAAGKVAAGDLSASVDIEGKDEVAELAASFNRMTEELLRLEEARRRIIADSAHELRTPVTLIRGAVEAMIDGIFPPDRANLESLHEETLRLSRLIDMLRELEAIDEGELILDIGDIDPLEIARKAASLFTQAARNKGLTITAMGESVPGARADALRLGEILQNLVANAMKYTPAGGSIEISVRAGPPARAGGEEDGAFTIEVADSGPGIPLEERDRVFERFYRMDRSRSRDSGGRGLGLSISLEIARAHGGGIEIGESRLGGALFRLTIPGRDRL